MHYVYILESEKTGKWYIGMSRDPEKRLVEEHNAGNVRATKGLRPYKLVYKEAHETQALAMRRERQIKNSGAIRKAIKRQINNMAPSSIGYPADRLCRLPDPAERSDSRGTAGFSGEAGPGSAGHPR